MRHWLLAAILLGTVLPLAADGGSKTYEDGLVAHYYKDPTNWDDRWPQTQSVPIPGTVPENWTFTSYQYSRVEPLVNHLFIRRGWFSVRWVGYLDVQPGHQAKGTPEAGQVTFELWMDDGARLFIDGVKLIDDWGACPETSARSHRRATVTLSRGYHKIVIEYFQGLSLEKNDHDPAKIYWSSADFGIPHQIIPASHFYHEDVND